MGSFEDLPNLRANLSSLIESGLKLKVIIEDLTPHLSVKPIEDILNKKAVSEVLMEGDASHF
jgi:hypothetical protein